MEPIRKVAATLLFVVLSLAAVVRSVQAQPNGDQMCGDGTTFSVPLPAEGSTVGNDSVTLPNGCRIYAVLVSGYARNYEFDELTFFKLARFVMANNGYVHYAWWNNLLREYMGRPLHDDSFRMPITGTVITATPGNLVGVHALGFAPPTVVDLVPKAVPEEDHQFQADAKRMLAAIRERNPNAIIIVAGHSMGGDAVARLGANTSVKIDLLAPIDPVGNRTEPVGATDHTDNWTRWRATREVFRGFRQADCVRNPSIPALCQDFDSRLLYFSYRCIAVGPYQSFPVLPPSRAPTICRGPVADPGVQRRFGANITRLYHRWQKETAFPFDWEKDYHFRHWAPLNASTDLAGPLNLQRPVLPNASGESNPNKTCSRVTSPDPRDPNRLCNPTDGHGEIVGFRFPTPDQPIVGPLETNLPVAPLALRMRGWPDRAEPGERRRLLIEMATSTTAWPHRPLDPDLCLVSDDMTAIVRAVLDAGRVEPGPTDTTAPVTVASPSPGPDPEGWNNEDVAVTLQATDEGGTGVATIQFALTGAQTGGESVEGDAADVPVSTEGTTTMSYFARDRAGNAGAAQELVVRIDKTPPEINAVADTLANPAGWRNTATIVSFPAEDGLSGLRSVSDSVMVSVEGAGQEITGSATDHASNEASASIIVNLDRTAPAVAVTTPADGATYLLRARASVAYSCSDPLSGVATCAGPVAAATPLDTSRVGHHAFTVQSADVAGNLIGHTARYTVRYGFSGFLPPPVPPQEMGSVRKLPFMWRLVDGLGAPISDPEAVVSITTRQVACDTRAPIGASEPARGRLDVKAGQYLFAWHTSRAWTGCRWLEVTLADGVTHVADVDRAFR